MSPDVLAWLLGLLAVFLYLAPAGYLIGIARSWFWYGRSVHQCGDGILVSCSHARRCARCLTTSVASSSSSSKVPPSPSPPSAGWASSRSWRSRR